MANRPTIRDLAQAAGVSVATVDRVLNGRSPVRPETARRVYEAATRLDYHAAGLIRQRLLEDLPRVKLGILLQKPRQYFFQEFASHLQECAGRQAGVQTTATVDFLQTQAPSEVVERLRDLARSSDAVAMVAPDHPSVTAEVQRLRDAGVAVFSVLSDFAPGVRAGYVGLDNHKAGRTAAWMIARTAPRAGKVAIFVGTHRFHGHELREIGFRASIREHAPDFEVLETLVNAETRQVTHEATLSLLHRHADLVGLYVAGGGMEGAIAALREERPAGAVRLVVPEITPETRAALADETVTMAIATPLPALCEELTRRMSGAALGIPDSAAPDRSFLPFSIYLPESV